MPSAAYRCALLAGLTGTILTACGSLGQPFRGITPADASSLPWTIVDLKKTDRDLFVDDSKNDAVDVLKNGSWKNVGSITVGIKGPNGNWVDENGNLYVANFFGSTGNVLEYSSGGSLRFTYDSGMVYPAAVVTDRNGNVYEADEFTGVNEYRRGSNAVVANCPQLGGGQRGIAVDSAGDVFVSYSTGDRSGGLAEYDGGLAGCHVKTLGVAIGVPGGLALDRKANLIASDETGQSVDVIDAPYSKISGYLGSNYSIPVAVAINKDNSEAYVTDWAGEEIDVLTYPAGAKIATLNSADGIGLPTGAVDSSNYVP